MKKACEIKMSFHHVEPRNILRELYLDFIDFSIRCYMKAHEENERFDPEYMRLIERACTYRNSASYIAWIYNIMPHDITPNPQWTYTTNWEE